jgi:osmotically-inducible protein OsmY
LNISFVTLAVFAALAGFSQAKPGAKPASTAKKISTSRGSADRLAPTDAELEKAIRARFAASKISADKFEVHVQGGRATITGNTGVLQHKGTATRLARAAGAKDVENKIEPSEAAKEKAGGNLAKGRRRAQIKRSETAPRSESR